MVSLGQERILVVGDSDRQMTGLIAQALPGAQVTVAGNCFDAIAQLIDHRFTTVMAAVEPIERRPEAAVRTLRELTGDGRLLLFGHPTLEPLSRKMLEFGCDDYIVTPCAAGELQQMFGAAQMRVAAEPAGLVSPESAGGSQPITLVAGLPLSEILMEALVAQPHDARRSVIDQVNGRLAPAMRLYHVPPGKTDPPAPDGMQTLKQAVRVDGQAAGTLLLMMPTGVDSASGRHMLSEIAHLLGKIGLLEERHNRLQRLAIVDDLTGVYNGRYFKHFLHKICERALQKQFSVTLLLFDIDDFKKYNDRFGHGVGDEILQQTAILMRRCCREHDLVARISGDEFAVVFWDKEGPRVPRDSGQRGGPSEAPIPFRPPQHPSQVFKRFKQLMASSEFGMLGTTGKGTLTISGGMASFPWETREPQKLIELADRRLMFGAKKCGKDSLILVGGEDCLEITTEKKSENGPPAPGSSFP